MTAATLDQMFVSAPRVGLDGLGEADLQRRIDRKYILSVDRLAPLVSSLQASHALLEVQGLTFFSYRSSYLDTADLACFHAHRQGRRLRWKARTRLYADSGRCRFEVKLKTGRGDTDKHSVVIPADEFGMVPDTGRELLELVLASQYQLPAPPDLAPSLTVQHSRSTLVAEHGGARATFDTGLVLTGPDATTTRLRDDLVLIETKSSTGRSAADLILRDAGVRPVSVSKYCAGIALTRHDAPDQPWRPLLRQHFLGAGSVNVAA